MANHPPQALKALSTVCCEAEFIDMSCSDDCVPSPTKTEISCFDSEQQASLQHSSSVHRVPSVSRTTSSRSQTECSFHLEGSVDRESYITSRRGRSVASQVINYDIASIIAEELFSQGDYNSLASLSRVNKTFNVAISRWLYRDIILDFNPMSSIYTAFLLRALLSNTQSNIFRYVWSLEVKMLMPENHAARRRLKANVLTAITRLVLLLPELRYFKWNVRQTMPKKLVEALQRRNHGQTVSQAMLVTCFGMSEERTFIERLSQNATITALAVEYRPHQHASINKINEILYYHKRLFLDHPRLKSLSIDMAGQRYGLTHDVFQLRPFENLPPVQELSLSSYHFESQWKGLHVNVNVDALTSLSLDKCRRLDFLFHSFSSRNASLKELRIRRPIWREGAVTRERQRVIFQRFLDSQPCIEVLELESLGFSSSILSAIVHESQGLNIRSIALRDLDHQIRSSTRDFHWGKTTAFKSLCSEDINQFRLHCPKLTDLAIDVAMEEFDSEAEIFSEAMMCTNLRYFSMTTQIDIDSTEHLLSHHSLCGIVGAAWGPKMQCVRITSRIVSGREQSQVDEETWVGKVKDDTVRVYSETARAADKRLKKLSKAAGITLHHFKDSQERKGYENYLKRKLEKLGKEALAKIDSSVGFVTRDCRPRKAKRQRIT